MTLQEQMRGRGIRPQPIDPKLARENAELHKTNAYLAEQARSAERAMERARYRR